MQFKREYVEKCVFAVGGIVTVDIQVPSPMQVFAKAVGLEGLLWLLKTEQRDALSKMEECFKQQ